MSNSTLVNYTKISPNSNNPRNKDIKKITIHHMAGNLTVESCGDIFSKSERQASSNYAIGTDGRVAMYVEESNRAWTSGSPENDNQAVTIEVANCSGAPDWKVSDTALSKLIDLCTDICQRNKIEKLTYTGDIRGNLTTHNMFRATTCPGPYLESKMQYIANEVNKKLTASTTTTASTTLNTNNTISTYTVKKGDTLSKIANEFKTTVAELTKLNSILNPNLINIGQIIKLPATTTTNATQSTIISAATTSGTQNLKVGQKVRIKEGATDLNSNKPFKSFVHSNTYDIIRLDGNKVIFGVGAAVTGVTDKSNIILQ